MLVDFWSYEDFTIRASLIFIFLENLPTNILLYQIGKSIKMDGKKEYIHFLK